MVQGSGARGRSLRVATVAAVAGLAFLVPSGLAQEATPVGGVAAGDGPHPAHIHAGTCDALGEVVAPLTEVADPTAAAGAQRSGPETADAVKVSQTTVDMPLQEIIDGGHAINVHLSADNIESYIACGDIGGVVITDDDGREEILIGLHELNGSGHSGVAWLGADGEQTEVAVVLVEPGGME